MARAVYSSGFFSGTGLTAGNSLTVPGTQIWVLRQVSAYARMDAFSSAQLFVHNPSGGAAIFKSWPNNSQTDFQWTGRLVYVNGSALSWQIQGGGAIDLFLSGYVLSLP